MWFPSDRSISTFAGFTCLLLLSSCVGRGKYLESLLVQESAKSEAASAKTDLADAIARYDQLASEYARVTREYDAQRQKAFNQQTGNLSERQDLVNTQTLQRLLIDSLTRDRKRLDAQRSAALSIIDAEEARLKQLQQRVTERAAAFPQGQLTMVRSDAELTLRIDQAALFDERRTTRISPAGDAALAMLASALGGQPDLRIDVIVAPRDLQGTASARARAAEQALAIVSNLVEGHGLAPELVRATALQTDSGTIAAAPAEAEANAFVQVVIRRSGDRVGELKRALLRE